MTLRKLTQPMMRMTGALATTSRVCIGPLSRAQQERDPRKLHYWQGLEGGCKRCANPRRAKSLGEGVWYTLLLIWWCRLREAVGGVAPGGRAERLRRVEARVVEVQLLCRRRQRLHLHLRQAGSAERPQAGGALSSSY